MALADLVVRADFAARGTLSEDTPLLYRQEFYTDSNGVTTGDVQHWTRLFNNTGGALIKNAVYQVAYDGDEEKNPQLIAITADTILPGHECVVAMEAAADQTWCWVCYAGTVDAMVEGTTDVAKDDFLKTTAATAADAFIKDGTSRTAKSFAIACAAQATNSDVATKVFLFGGEHDVD